MSSLTVREFRDLGLLQEVNRRVLHPAGVALFLLGAEGDEARAFRVEILDGRGEPGGLAFAFDQRGWPTSEEAAAKAGSVDAMHLERRAAREREVGAVVQLIRGREEGEPASLDSGDATVELALSLARAAVEHVLPGAEEIPSTADELVEAILLRCVGPLVASLRAAPGGRLYVPGKPSEAPAAPAPSLDRRQLARARWLSRELPRLAGPHEVSGGVAADGRLSARTVETELYPAEAEEARVLAAQAAAWPLDRAPEEGARVLSRMEDLFSLAQPGMRFWRGDRPDVEAAADSIHARLDAWRARRTEFDRFLSGDLSARDLSDPAAVREELEARAAPLREELAEIDAQRAAAAGALAPVEAALARLGDLSPISAPPTLRREER